MLFVGLLALTVSFLLYLRIQQEFDRLHFQIGRLSRENAVIKQAARDHIAIEERLFHDANLNKSPFSNPSAETDPGGSIERVIQLKQYLAAHPSKGIPELRLLTDDDWLSQIKDITLDTEASERKGLALVRQVAQERLGQMVASAIIDFVAANNGKMPTNPDQLASYLANASDADLLRGLETSDPTAKHGGAAGWLFQKELSVDDWYDSASYIRTNEYLTNGTGVGWSVENAIVAYQKATGALPNDASLIVPFLKEEIEPSTVVAIFSALQTSPTSPPALPSGPPLPHRDLGIGRF